MFSPHGREHLQSSVARLAGAGLLLELMVERYRFRHKTLLAEMSSAGSGRSGLSLGLRHIRTPPTFLRPPPRCCGGGHTQLSVATKRTCRRGVRSTQVVPVRVECIYP